VRLQIEEATSDYVTSEKAIHLNRKGAPMAGRPLALAAKQPFHGA